MKKCNLDEFEFMMPTIEEKNGIKTNKLIYSNSFDTYCIPQYIQHPSLECYLSGEIDIDFLHAVIKMKSDIRHSIYSELCPNIIINFSSIGGDVSYGWQSINVLNSIRYDLNKNITIICNGDVASMGLLFMLAGDIRLAYPNISYLYHSMSASNFGKIHEISQENSDLVQTQENIINYVISRTKIKKQQLINKQKDEWFFYNEEAIKNGFIHGTLTENEPIVKSK